MELKLQISKLRFGAGLSQEEFAALLGVSRQAVQKWESGSTVPGLDHLVKMTKLFRVTLDSLVLEGSHRVTEELQRRSEIGPDYEHMNYWESYSQNLHNEYRQSVEEGKDIGMYEKLFQAVQEMPAGEYKEKMADLLFDIVCSAGTVEGYPYVEPSDYHEIKALSSGEILPMKQLSEPELKEKIEGAWLGRICGCLLGKPIEGIRSPDLTKLLKASGNDPMHRYICNSDLTPALEDEISYRVRRDILGDAVTFAPSDDDTNYTVLASVMVERYGRDFKPADVANTWVQLQGKDAYCTAERVAFKNFVMGYRPPTSAIYKNVYREWIGAQIRGDYFGYINPGDPAAAAEMAWRDASISHVKNGIYGEMFVAAMIAAAAGCHDMEAIIHMGLAQIPSSSRLWKSVKEIVDGWRSGVSKSETFAKIHDEYDEYSDHGWCHTISNAMIVTAALVYGGGDYTKSIGTAVETGFDTDCNGATVGSILGMMNGASSIGKQWTDPIHRTLDTSIFGVGKVSVDDMVERTMKHIKAK